ncbi:MAG: HPr family phosphocarrier protein [Thermoprotei archaeon]
MKSVEVKIVNKHGLHARPAVRFVQLASKFRSQIFICKQNKCADAKNILKVLSLGIDCGDTVTLKVDGEDEEKALEQLLHLLQVVLPKEDQG